MKKQRAQLAKVTAVRGAILSALKDGVCTTEQLRVSACETMEVVYSHLVHLKREGLIESNHPPKMSIMKKWRLTQKGRDFKAAPPLPTVESEV